MRIKKRKRERERGMEAGADRREQVEGNFECESLRLAASLLLFQ